MEFAIKNGRNGKGCVICFAAGNGNESVNNDGYASYEKVIAVAACNDKGKKAPYSDFGPAVWCAFPSSNVFPSLTPGIWTTDRSGPSATIMAAPASATPRATIPTTSAELPALVRGGRRGGADPRAQSEPPLG